MRLSILALLIFTSMTAACAPGQDPLIIPVETSPPSESRSFLFTKDAEGWSAWNQLRPFKVTEGILTTEASGNDPYMSSPPIKSDVFSLEVRMRVSAGGRAEVFWTTATDSGWGTNDKVVGFDLDPGPVFRTYLVPLPPARAVEQLRLDVGDAPATVEIDYVKIYKE